MAQRQLRQRVAQAIQSLPERQRALLVSHYYKGESLAAAGRSVGISRSYALRVHRSALLQLREKLDFDILWMAEHHFQREGYECIPNLLILSQYLSQHTEKIKFGCGFNIGPMWHPLRLAEDYATADVLTGGRVIFGLGRGYHSREVESFGAPILDQDANKELFEEQVEIIFKAFNEPSFSHHGKHYDIPAKVPYRGYELRELTLVPRPVNPVECWNCWKACGTVVFTMHSRASAGIALID